MGKTETANRGKISQLRVLMQARKRDEFCSRIRLGSTFKDVNNIHTHLLLCLLLLVHSDGLGDQHPQQSGPGLLKLSPAAPA